jgi:hypothetical protein
MMDKIAEFALSIIGAVVGLGVSLCLLLLLTGCSTDSALRAQIAGANIELARHKAEVAAKPILDAQIPTPSGMMVIVVHAPQGANTAQITMPDDPWARAADRAVGVLGTAAGLYLVSPHTGGMWRRDPGLCTPKEDALRAFATHWPAAAGAAPNSTVITQALERLVFGGSAGAARGTVPCGPGLDICGGVDAFCVMV